MHVGRCRKPVFEDGAIEIGGRGVFCGRQRILEFIGGRFSLTYGVLLNHFQLQPFITVADDRKSAKGRWRARIEVGFLDELSRVGEAIYENEYVKVGGVWQISKPMPTSPIISMQTKVGTKVAILWMAISKGWSRICRQPKSMVRFLRSTSCHFTFLIQ